MKNKLELKDDTAAHLVERQRSEGNEDSDAGEGLQLSVLVVLRLTLETGHSSKWQPFTCSVI